MPCKDLLSQDFSCLNYKDSISKYSFKDDICFQNKDKILGKSYIKKRDFKLRQMKFQNLQKQFLNLSQKLNFRNENIILSRQRCRFQIKYKKMISKDLKYKVIGGGCMSSKQIDNIQKINFNQYKEELNKDFMYDYDKFTSKENIANNTKDNIIEAIQMQVHIIKFIKSYDIIIRNKIIAYKPKLIELIDVFLIYVLIGSSQTEVFKESEIQELELQLNEIKLSFEKVSLENPTCDLIFYFDLLFRINSTRIGKDEQNKSKLIQVVELITIIVKLGSTTLKKQGRKMMEGIDSALQGSKQLIKSYQQSKTNKIFTYLLDIWVRKTDQFRGRIWNLTLVEELETFITIFNELCSQQDYESDLVLITLIKIDHCFGQAVEDENNLKTLSQELSLDCDLIKTFIPILIQKSDSWGMFDEMKFFLKFTVENHTYRFLTISILLKYNKIMKATKDSQEYKEQIMEYLCYKYLCEKDKSVKLAFETNIEFVDHFNSKIEKEEFKDKIIQLSSERSKVLKIFELEKYEEKIENSQDIERMIANTILEKWVRDVKRRQQDNITQKDDVLLEVIDLYIEQQITYLQGQKIFQPKQSLTQINQNSLPHQKRQNAFEQILENFLIANINTHENQNANTSRTKEQNRCKIIGVLAEGGTGKSMLIKKLETHLIQSANSNSEKESYIPLLIKCNSLDPAQPSIDNYLKEQGVTKQQINQMKKSDRNKVILLDGYDEFTGEYFRVYKQLKLNEWKNTKVIVTSRKEKLELSEACTNFSLDDDYGRRDETSYCIVKLEGFTNEDILEYYKMYFRKYRTNEEKFDEVQYKNDLVAMEDCIKNPSLENLLYLPINLYLFTRMIVQVKDKNEILNIKESISDQIGIQDIFFKQQFKREAQDFVQTCKELSKTNQDLDQIIVNSFFEYFQSISMSMFLNKGKITNFLQIQKNQIKFKMSNEIESKLSQNEKNSLFEKIIHYINSQIITRSKEEIKMEITNSPKNKNYLIEFKHKSLFEYFAARAMKYDFDLHADNIYKLMIEQLKEFNINQKCIMNIGQNQSEQQILIKLYKMFKNEIESSEFYQNYHLEQIEKNSRYIQYIKKSIIKNNREMSQIDIGASNLLSALFLSQYAYSKLNLKFCSFSKLYVNSLKSDYINFENCNMQSAYLKNLHINYDSCNTEFATFDGYQKVFDTLNIYSMNQFIWDQRNLLYTITDAGFINVFKIVNQNIVLQKSKRLSQVSLNQILNMQNDNLLISTQYSLLLINSNSFDLQQSYKFKNQISCIIQIYENILVVFENKNIFYGSFYNGFRKMNMIGSGCAFNEFQQLLLVYQDDKFSFYSIKKNFELINTIQGHTDTILSVAFSGDGKYLATGSQDMSCKIWNTEKGFELINTIQGHTNWVKSVAFSGDGRYLVTGSDDMSCKIWNIEKGFELINTVQGHANKIRFVAFSADGKYLATGSEDKSCKIWNAEKDFDPINTIQDHTEAIWSVAFSGDGKYLATGSFDKSCKIWNAEKGFELINTILGHTSYVTSVVFSRDGKYLATGSKDQSCKIWNAENGFELINTIQGHTDTILSVGFSADGKYLATGSKDKSCKIWNPEKVFELINTIQGHTGNIVSVAFSGNGKYLATCSEDKSCKIWNAEKGFELINTIGHTEAISSITFSVDGKYLATGSYQSCQIWNAEKCFELINIISGLTDWVNSVAFSGDGKYLATGSQDKSSKIWNAEKGFDLINTIQGHKEPIQSVAFSRDGKYLATGSSDKSFKIWNLEKGFELINTIQGHTHLVRSAAFSKDGKYLATGSDDQSCKIWNAEKSFELINTIQGHTFQVISVAFSADGKYLATGSYQSCKIWYAEKGFEHINTIQGHTDWVKSVAFSSDGKYLATGSYDKSCKIWNAVKDFELFNTIQGHTSIVRSVCFSGDSKYLATGSDDKSCKIWNAQKGFELINIIQGQTGDIVSVAFSGNGKYLVTGSNDNTCNIWNVEKGFELFNTIKGQILSIAFSEDGKYLAICQFQNCQIWNVEKGFELIYTIYSHTDWVNSAAFSSDGKYLVTSSFQNCKIWNAEKGIELINIFSGHTFNVTAVAFSGDGKYMALGSFQNFKIWNVEKGFELINTIKGHTAYVTSVAFSGDGKYLATGSSDNSCKIWNIEKSFELNNTIQGHTSYVTSVAFSGDGKYLATGSEDRSCKIWNAEKGFELINTIQGHEEPILSIAFSSDVKYVFVQYQNQCYNIFDFSNQKIDKDYISYETLNQKYQFEQSANTFDEMKLKIFENLFIL